MAQPEGEGYTARGSKRKGGIVIAVLLLIGAGYLYSNGTFDKMFASKPVAAAKH
jgi:hypothetical protein